MPRETHNTRALLVGSAHMLAVSGMTRPSTNRKTGDMVGYTVMRRDITPTQSIAQQQQTPCGACPLKRSCYVNPVPLNAIHRAALAAPLFRTVEEMADTVRPLNMPGRFTVWGDMGMIRREIAAPLYAAHPYITGYTHTWTRKGFDDWHLSNLMGSVDHPTARRIGTDLDGAVERVEALGGRAYVVLRDDEEPRPGWLKCPHDPHARKPVQCAACGLCNGGPRTRKRPHIWTRVSGSPNKRTNYNRQYANHR